jgi:acyl-CoA synthetase (AMP-forming)/AMP-acid ligase II
VGADVAGWSAYGDLVEGASDDEPPVQLGVEDDCNIIYSSGTTGDPKGIVLTHFSRREAAIGLALEFRIDCTARTLVTTPLCSNGSWMMFLPTFLVGGAIVIMPSFDPRDFLRLVQQHRCTHTFIVPTQSITILSVPEFGDYDLSSMRIIVSAGAPLREETKRELLRKFAAGIVELYGLTEGFATFMRPEEMARKIGSVGTPTMGADVAILDDEGNELPPGEVGEIAGYATGRMRGYYKKPEATAAVWWQDRKGRVFIKTGDIGRLDKDGYLYIMDRKKDMIITGGFNVFPKDIEEVIMRHPDVVDATVIGVPHEKWGETPLALVIRREGAKTTEDMLAEWINQNVAKHQRVAGVEFRDALPRNLLGKVLKRQLREYYWSRRVG